MRQTEGEMFLAEEVASAKALGWGLVIQQRVSVFVVKGGKREEDTGAHWDCALGDWRMCGLQTGHMVMTSPWQLCGNSLMGVVMS